MLNSIGRKVVFATLQRLTSRQMVCSGAHPMAMSELTVCPIQVGRKDMGSNGIGQS